MRSCRTPYQSERHLTVDEGYRRPDERCEPSVVADERREGQLAFIDVHNYVAGQEPRGSLNPYPVLAAIGDLPPEQAIRGRSQLKAKAEEDTLDNWDEEEQTTRHSLQRRADQLLGCSAWRLINRSGDDVGVIGVRERAKTVNRLGNVPPPPDGRGGCTSVTTGREMVGVLG